MFTKETKLKSKGFTLVETLVAVSIFSLSVLALMAVLSDSVMSTSYAKKKIIAAYLAQEGIEYIRNLRDTHVLYQAGTTDGWSDFKNKIALCDTEETPGCYFEQDLDYFDPTKPIIDIPINECPADCPSLLHNSTSGKYNYTTGEETDFARKINITYITDDEVKVVSTVSWVQGSGEYEISFSEHLFNWTK